jgi:hypothetical protein
MDYLNSTIIMVNETDDGYGYICSRYIDTIYVKYWAPGLDTKGTSFHSPKYMYEQAKVFTSSLLTNYSPSHVAQNLMFQAYVKWYENNY